MFLFSRCRFDLKSRSTLTSDTGDMSTSDGFFSSKAPQGEIEVLGATVPEGITYKLPLPPPGVEIHTYVKESIKVVYISVLH